MDSSGYPAGMTSNSALRAKLDRLQPTLASAARAVIGPALDLPDDAKSWPLIRETLKQLYLFAPVHAVLFATLGLPLARLVPVSAACDPKVIQMARLTFLVLYEVLAVPLLTLLSAFAVRRRFRDPYTRHSAKIALGLLMAVFAGVLWSAAASFMREDARLRGFGAEVLRCAYDGTPPSEIVSPR
jgi:hypothetical protein